MRNGPAAPFATGPEWSGEHLARLDCLKHRAEIVAVSLGELDVALDGLPV